MKNAFFTLILVIAATISLNAQSFARLDKRDVPPVCEYIASSYGVAKGRIVESEIYLNQEGTRCYYHYTLEVKETIKGKLPKRIVVVEEIQANQQASIDTRYRALAVGSEIMACFNRIPRDWECGYTPRHAYASVVNYDSFNNQLITCLKE